MKETPKRPIILVGGGTGGHITPLIAVAEELTASHQQFIFIGGRDSHEERLVKEQGWRFISISSGKWRRYTTPFSLLDNIIDLLRVKMAFWQALRILIRTRARVVFSKGGNVAFPVVLAAALLHRKIIIHESDSVMGLTNRVSQLFATRVLTGFPLASYGNTGDKYRFVGIPVRRAIRQAATSKKLKKARPLIFVIAGSQGSAAINGFVRQSLEKILTIADLVHITGEKEFDAFHKLRSELPRERQAMYRIFGYLTRELPYYFAMSDLIIGRASATIIAEAALFNRAMILIPLPGSAGDHQKTNAKLLSSASAAVYFDQDDNTAARMLASTEELLKESPKREQLGDNLHRYFADGEALSKIIEELN